MKYQLTAQRIKETLMTKIAWFLLLFLLLFFPVLPGCAINRMLESGPRTMETIAGGVQVIASDILSRVDWDAGQAGADGSVNDPEFQFDVFIGTGVRMELVGRLIGTNLSFDVDAWGSGADGVVPADFVMLHNAWRAGELSNDEYNVRFFELLTGLLNPGDGPKE
jgi:hypothetical protein